MSNTPMKYYDSNLPAYLECSLEFTKTLKTLGRSSETRSVLKAATSWIDKASNAETSSKQKKVDELMNEYIEADGKSVQDMSMVINALLLDYDQFRGKIKGAVAPGPELTAFLEAAESGVEAKLIYRDALMFRNNANTLLKAREKVKQKNAGSDSGILMQLKSFAPIFGAAMKG